MYTITKTYGNEQGLSATFRQWRADSHCRFLHGYALGFEVTIACNDDNLDARNWVYSFGGFKPFKAWLQDTFDHKTVVAEDDPQLEVFMQLSMTDTSHGGHTMLQLRVVEAVGCA
ncbi:6-pyruvoyl trahydropterin synthase family protein [Parvimonas sp. M13]|uniref:6-pyruvoyl trahydropterin synthase family protein n=1 Tax=Parvimonas sp. M13 TaxID=3110694 RepID=UPI002B4AA9BE|nr:6-carboxytetrahydropterin synthase [Parvimonas sp. M13]MEB3025883.1 6-carboxytetrahydropterin synthase [Parvimonas sp. M13]